MLVAAQCVAPPPVHPTCLPLHPAARTAPVAARPKTLPQPSPWQTPSANPAKRHPATLLHPSFIARHCPNLQHLSLAPPPSAAAGAAPAPPTAGDAPGGMGPALLRLLAASPHLCSASLLDVGAGDEALALLAARCGGLRHLAIGRRAGERGLGGRGGRAISPIALPCRLAVAGACRLGVGIVACPLTSLPPPLPPLSPPQD